MPLGPATRAKTPHRAAPRSVTRPSADSALAGLTSVADGHLEICKA